MKKFQVVPGAVPSIDGGHRFCFSTEDFGHTTPGMGPSPYDFSFILNFINYV